MHAAQDADISRYLMAADVIVTDHSSVGFEFMLLDRPIVVIDSPELLDKARVAPDKARLLRNAATVAASSAAAVTKAVTHALANPSELSAERRATAARLFYRPGTATARAVECVYNVLELPMHAFASAPASVLSASTITASTGTTHHV